jgi:uncharacterized protein
MKPILINNLEFAKRQEKIEHEIVVDSCGRLLDLLVDDSTLSRRIQYSLVGNSSKLHLPSLRLKVEASLPVTCQRCLLPMQLDLSFSHNYVIAEMDPAPFDGDEEVDWLEAARDMNVNELVEDELLIAIPLGPLHSHACKPLIQEDVEKQNPFAILKNIIK